MAYSARYVSIKSPWQGNGEANDRARTKKFLNFTRSEPSVGGDVEHPGLVELNDGCYRGR
tara:strand:+ start:594 stop:773 length:180 start_codon:yes stop_codon:yes gene_type:complete